MARVRRAFRLPLPARLGLRARITFAFAATTAVLAALLAGTTWGLTRENLINQREASATRQATLNATVMSERVQANQDTEALVAAMASLQTPASSRPSVELRQTDDTWRSVSLQSTFGQAVIPDSVRDAVTGGDSVRMRVTLNGEPELIVGIPVNEGSAAYYEVVSFADLEDTLESLAVSLLGASVATTLVGGTLGYWLSRRTLRPLANVGLAAEAIAGGRLDTRLEGTEDPDLNVLVSSFNHMAQALEARIDRDGRFASDVSHELRSPLMTLAASVSVLASRRGEMPDDASRSALDLMEGDVARFQQLVDDLLEISRFDAGVARLSLEEVRLPELIRQAVAQHRTGRAEVAVELDAELAGMVVRADKRRLVRILDNLLGNADAYGGGASRISVESAGDSVLVAVEDSGPGVPIDDRGRIFDRFSRGAGAGRRSASGDGVGLGLALVAEHARLHGGRTWVEDRPDGAPGARFVVQLPVARA
ncbi:HAMP domain-containing sensor histidine kinase [Iamia sp.]|uniref:HAMP domain-containing sensor histidine kinase n=1 Tax=Iamia sp. TaxID=2722710 RepID=UPI002BCF7410|nr:HAMP domain-containing sensor histidine kinase [Iamia sp.]HXH59183.1 HAMP domain-containing sensor histidine kinase [Iamia sp.]